MALNLSKKIGVMDDDDGSGNINDPAVCLIGGDDILGGSLMGGAGDLSAAMAAFQPLDLSLKGPSNNRRTSSQQVMNNSGRKRLLPWTSSSRHHHHAASSSSNNSHDRGSDYDISDSNNNNGSNNDNNRSESDSTIVVVDDDGDSGTALQLLEDNPNENGAYACHYCTNPPSMPVIFQTWAAIQAHFQSCHPNERPFACPLAPGCPYSTKWFCDMRIHFRRHHPDIANSPRQLYDAIQLVKDRTTMPPMQQLAPTHQQSPASSSSPPSTDSLLMIASKLPLLMGGSAMSYNQSTHRQQQKRSNNQPMPPLGPNGNKKSHQSFNTHQESAFWAKAVGQQPRADIRQVKAIKIDCRSVHKALNNHRQQQQQQQASPLRSMALNATSASSNFIGDPDNKNRRSNNGDLLSNGNQRIPYKFQCPLCNYRTQRQTNFECHVACHENLRIYKCSACAYRSNWKWDLKKHIRQVHPIDVDGERRQQPAEKIFIGKVDDNDSLDGADNGGGGVEGGAAKILVMPLEEARRTVDTYLKQVGKSAEKFLLKCVLCPFVTKRRKLLTRHHQQTHGLRPEECCATDDFVVALPSSPESAVGDQAANDGVLN